MAQAVEREVKSAPRGLPNRGTKGQPPDEQEREKDKEKENSEKREEEGDHQEAPPEENPEEEEVPDEEDGQEYQEDKALPEEGSEEEHDPNQQEEDLGDQEPYGAQVLRRVHQDHLVLMQDYDEMLGPVDNEHMRAFLEATLEKLEATLSEVEKAFDEFYNHLPQLEGNMGEEQGDDTRPGEVPPQEAAEATMGHKYLIINGKKYIQVPNKKSNPGESQYEHQARNMNQGSPTFKVGQAVGVPHRSGKLRGGKVVHVDKDSGGNYLYTVHHGPGDIGRHPEENVRHLSNPGQKNMYGKKSRHGDPAEDYDELNAEDTDLGNEENQPHDGEPGVDEAEDTDLGEEEDQPHDGIPGVDVAEDTDLGEEEDQLEDHHKKTVSSAHQFLGGLGGLKSLEDTHRMEAYHHHKGLEGVLEDRGGYKGYEPGEMAEKGGMVDDEEEEGGDEEEKGLKKDFYDPDDEKKKRDDDPDKAFGPAPMYKALHDASGYLLRLAHTKDFGEPHRAEAAYHMKELNPIAGLVNRDLEGGDQRIPEGGEEDIPHPEEGIENLEHNEELEGNHLKSVLDAQQKAMTDLNAKIKELASL